MKQFYLTLAFVLLGAASAFAQFTAVITVTDNGTGMPVQNASVSLDGNVHTTNAAGHAVFPGLADNTYPYSVSATCYFDGASTITIAGANASTSLGLDATTTNNVFFFIGDPMAITGAFVEVYDGANYYQSFTTSDPFGGEILADVPFGEYSYTITTPCYATVTGTVTVDCNNGDGIAVFENPAELTIDPTVTLVDHTLTASMVGVDYQWVDCNNGNAPIDGANGQSFEPTGNGNYAVILGSGDCAQTSACTAVIVTGVTEQDGADAFAVYPVPFADQLTVHTNGNLGPVRSELFNLSGQLLLDETGSGTEISLSTAELPAGSYILRLTSNNARTTMSVVK